MNLRERVTTVRLEPPLSERLRTASFHQRQKKQPIIRAAVNQFLLAWEEAPAARREKMAEALRAPVDLSGAIAESVRLDYKDHERLRLFQYQADVPRQAALRASLIQYLDQYEAENAPEPKKKPRLVNRKPRAK